MRFLSRSALGLLVLVICGAVGCSSASRESSGGSSSDVEKLLTEKPSKEIKALDLQGSTVSLSGMKGKVVLLNFWGSWCGPCRMEAPELVRMREELQSQGFEVLGVNYGDQRNEALAFMAEQKMRFPVVLDEGFTDLYEVNGFPTNIVIDRQGKIRYHVEGYHPQEMTRLRRIVEHLLAL